MLVFHTQLLLQFNNVTLEETNDLATYGMPEGPPQLLIPGVHFQALPGCVHRIGCGLQSSFHLDVSISTLPLSPSLLGWVHQFSCSHDGRRECDFHAVHSAISSWVCSKVPFNRRGHLLSKMGIGNQAPTIDWWLRWDLQPAGLSKMADALDGGGHNIVVRNGKEGGLGVHRNGQFNFASALSR